MRRAAVFLAGSVLGWGSLAFSELLAEGPHAHQPKQFTWLSGTYLDPAIARPDLLPHAVWNSIPEHRRVFNRPWYGTGKFLYHFEPTSQEAMAWESNVANGNYRNHRGASVPMYWYPKPWEAINTRARPDFPRESGIEVSRDKASLMELVEPAPR
jgi:hypothetical protein